MKDFFTEVEKTYQNALETEGELLLECKEIWSENCIDSYEDKVMEFVLQLHEKINSSYDQNKNFVNYLKEIRMREAKKLLTETDMKIIEISQAVGYDNEKHFMKIFKATCGVSPTEYRHNAYLSKS